MTNKNFIFGTPVNEPIEDGKSYSSIIAISPREPRYNFDDLVLPEDTLNELSVLQSMIFNHDLVYDKWKMSEIDPYGNQKAFNLFGPSGTGKTMIIEALCKRWNKKLIDVDLSQVESKYVGDTGKNIVSLFKLAEAKKAVLFFDEADAIFGKRVIEINQSADSNINTARGVMLKQLEQYSGIVAFASNFAKNYDPAFVRRICKHIEIKLPNLSLRKILWNRKIPEKVPGKNEIDFDKLAEKSEGFSGGDILVVVKNSLFEVACLNKKILTTSILLKNILLVENAKNKVAISNLII